MADEARPHGNWLLVAALVAAAVLSYVNRQAPTLLVDPLRRDLGLDDIRISLLIGASFAVVYALSSLGLGWLSDRRSRTRIIAAAILLWSIGSIGCAFSGSFAQLFACRMLIGASEAALIPAALSLIADNFSERRRGLATGTFLVGIFGGAGGSIVIVGYLLGVAGRGPFAVLPYADTPWRQVFMLAAFPGLLLLPFFLLRRDDRGGAPREIAGAGMTTAAVMQWRAIGLLCAALTLVSISDNAVMAWVPSLLIRDFGVSAPQVGRYLGVSLMIGGSAGVLLGGWLSDRFAASRWGRSSVCAIAVTLAIPPAISMLVHDATTVILCMGLYLAISAAATCAGTSALLAITVPERRGLVASILTLCSVAIGFGVGPSFAVIAADRLHGLSHGLVAVTTGSLLGAGLLFVTHIVRPVRRIAPV